MVNKSNLTASLVIVLVLSAIANNSLASTAGYFIGNSLTVDSQPEGISALANVNGNSLTVGYHIRGGKPLDYIWNNPDDYNEGTNSFGGYSNALSSNAWDFVSVQPFYHADSTLSSDTQSILNFIELNEAGPSTSTEYYIYAAWPSQPSDYKSTWTRSVPDTPEQPTLHAREYFDNLYSGVTDALGNSASVNIIPIGEVFYSLELLFDSGAVPGFTDVSQLYRDRTHLDFDIGRWVAANTVYASIFKEDPSGLQKPVGFYEPSVGSSVLTDELNAQIQSVIWDVVSSDIRTGVVPVPAAVWLFGSGLIGLIGIARRKKA